MTFGSGVVLFFPPLLPLRADRGVLGCLTKCQTTFWIPLSVPEKIPTFSLKSRSFSPGEMIVSDRVNHPNIEDLINLFEL